MRIQNIVLLFVYSFLFTSLVMAQETSIYKWSQVFLGDYRVYQDPGHTPLKSNDGSKDVLTKNLSAIKIIAVEVGLKRANSDKYVKVEALVDGGKRHIVWIHKSGTIKSIQGLLEKLNSQISSIPWGDPLLTEAYNKNKHLSLGWFEAVKHFFDPNSKLAKQMIAGATAKNDLINSNPKWSRFIIDLENEVPIFNENKEWNDQSLEPGTVIEVQIPQRFYFDSAKNTYVENKTQITPYVRFRTVPNFYADPVLSGYVHISSLRSPLAPSATSEELDKKYERYTEILQKKFSNEDNSLTVRRALEQFHSSICTIEADYNDRDKNALLKKWEIFVKSKTNEKSRQTARNAQHVDIIARTILGEAQNEAHLYNPESIQKLESKVFHPQAVSCQRDIIALSVRNRAFTKQFAAFGHKYVGDFTGAASTGSQYNAWFPHLVEHQNFRITSCFGFENDNYIEKRKRSDSSYPKLRERYKSIASRLPLVLGISQAQGLPAMGNPSYLDNFFQANPSSKLSKKENIESLSSYRNYYHPNNGGLKKANARDAVLNHRYGLFENGFVEVTYKSQSRGTYSVFYPVTEGKLTRFDERKVPSRFLVRLKDRSLDHAKNAEFRNHVEVPKYTFEIQVGSRWVKGSDFFAKKDESAEARILEYKLEGAVVASNQKWGLLPNAVFPQCFKKDGYISDGALANGIRVPLHWFSKDVRNSAADALNQLLGAGNSSTQNFMGGAYYGVDGSVKNSFTAYGRPVEIQCIDDIYYSEAHAQINDGYPKFGGYCDPNIMLVQGM